jgi:hypothetical protein
VASASSASSHPALSSLGVTYLAPTLARLVHSGYSNVSSSRSGAYGHTYDIPLLLRESHS